MNLKFSVLILLAITLMLSCKPKINSNQNMTQNDTLIHAEWSKNAIIYEVNLRQYTPEGTIKAFIPHIERLHQMGVDILWLMPINPIGEKNRKGSLGSYYAISDYTAVNPEFGTLTDVQELVNKAHSLGMKVIIDWVANHTAWDNVWVEQHPDWYQKDSLGNLVSPFDWTDVLALDYDNHALWKGMADAMLYWMDTAKVDGFRCDVAMLVRTEFWDSVRPLFEQRNPEVFMLAEAELPEHHNRAFDMSYAWEMHHAMAAVAKGEKPATALGERIMEDLGKFGPDAYRMQFTTNHDENSWNGTEYEKMNEAVNAMAALTFVMPGMPLIYSGQEAANKDRLRFFEKDTLDFSKTPMAELYKNLSQLKKQNSALWNGNFGGSFEIVTTSNPEKVFAFKRVKDQNTVIYLANYSAEKVEITFSALEGDFKIWGQPNAIKIAAGQKISLDPWQYLILVK